MERTEAVEKYWSLERRLEHIAWDTESYDVRSMIDTQRFLRFEQYCFEVPRILKEQATLGRIIYPDLKNVIPFTTK